MANLRYEKLLAPLPVGDILLKTHMTSASATPHFIQGTEKFPTEKWITMLANRARAGAAAIAINHLESGSPQTGDLSNTPGHFSIMDFQDTILFPILNYFVLQKELVFL